MGKTGGSKRNSDLLEEEEEEELARNDFSANFQARAAEHDGCSGSLQDVCAHQLRGSTAAAGHQLGGQGRM